jgi:hypothetical protein
MANVTPGWEDPGREALQPAGQAGSQHIATDQQHLFLTIARLDRGRERAVRA